MQGGLIKYLFLLILAWPVSHGLGQPFGNEWINFNQQYYKIKTGSTGIYRLSFDNLAASGFPVNSVDPRRIRLYHRGVEQAIQLNGQSDARFDPADYIEFFGIKNDGATDVSLYVSPDAIPHLYYNLYSDTTSYFLTWGLDATPGKRISTFSENNVDNLPPEPYIWKKKLVVNASEYSPGRHYPLGQPSAEVLLATYDYGEGWTGPAIRKDTYADILLDSMVSIYTSGPSPVLDILLAGRNNLAHGLEIWAGPSSSNLRSLGTINFEYHNTYLFSSNLEFTDIGAGGNLVIRISVTGVNSTDPDFVSVSYIRVRYPQQPTALDSKTITFHTPQNANNKSFIGINGVSNPGKLWDITDLSNITNIGFNITGSTLSAIIPNTVTERKLYITDDAFIEPMVESIKFRRIVPSDFNYLIITHPKLLQPGGSYQDPVKAYASYRASPQGGGFDTLVMEIGQLYDQFSYGEISPLAIRNFCEFAASSGNTTYLLLIGKSLYQYHNFYRSPPGSIAAEDLVPTYGYPGSDALFSAGLNGSTYQAGFLTGRIPAQTSSDVAAYLDKVKEAELFNYEFLWKKDLIHLSGGITQGELVLFKAIVEEFRAVAEDHYLGGKVTTVSKETNNSVELINISEEINNGKMMVTFFGHSAANLTDIDIGYVSDPVLGYNNKGKYPFMLVNGCNAGNIFTTLESIGEDWITTPDKGAVGFFAHAGVGITTQLKRFTDTFYATAFADSSMIYKSIGEILRETSRRYLTASFPTQTNIGQVQQNVLQGDPAIPLFGASRPDYAIFNDDLSITTSDQSRVIASIDSFDIAFIIRNYGSTVEDSFYVTVNRRLPDGTVIYHEPVLYAPVLYMDTLYYTINNINVNAFGLNQFDVEIDPFDSVSELSGLNNTAYLQYYFPKQGTQNLVPYPYAISAENPVILTAQATDLLSGQRNFLMEADTVPGFDSPALLSAGIPGKSLAEWETDLPEADCTVYFWRSKFSDIQPGEEDTWSGSSFYYIKDGPEGWAQAHPYQLRQNQLNGLEYDSLQKKWKFEENSSRIQLTTFGDAHPDKDYEDVVLLLNGNLYIYNTRLCSDNSINALAFDYASTNPYLVLKFGFYDILDRRSCGKQPQVINNFLNSEILGTEDYLTQYINAVKDGDYVLLFSIGEVTFESWPADLKNKLAEIGASVTMVNSLLNGEPVIILGRKGSAEGTAILIKADPSSPVPADQQQIDMDETISGSFTSGTITSGPIGPSKDWDQFTITVSHMNNPAEEEYYIDLFGMDVQGNETLLFENLTAGTSLDLINAVQYPYLRARFETNNNVSLTPAQLNKWIFIFTPMPEGILLPAEGQSISGNEIHEGEIFESRFEFRNLSSTAFSDSLKVNYRVFNQDKKQSTEGTLTAGLVPPDTSIMFSINLSSLGFGGKNNLSVYANPKLVPERFFNNNILDLTDFFTVAVDKTHPLIDVAIDGRYILDGEIVSPNPAIRIRIKDENKILPKQDTTGIDIFLKNPCEGCGFKRVNLSNPDVQWTPARQDMDFTVDYSPRNLENGIYTLQVQAEDASGNPSGSLPYTIRFEVVNESTITNFYPFPNPFSTSVRFVFTLTGGEMPDNLKIQIMTISGKVVREIMQDEIGPIHIGNNITQYAWDGKDEFGDQLANGVYLYRVIARIGGNTIPLRETAGDKAFTRGFGKMYLLR